MCTIHKIYIGDARLLSKTADDSVNLVVTSPPYPMIQMWDECFSRQDIAIGDAIKNDPERAFELMHQQLDRVWRRCFNVLKDGGFLCINIGDATRTINSKFKLYNNHTRISDACNSIGFTMLPSIIWRKQINAPNKFMGSGMLPCGAYVTLEHEWILIFRKGNKRQYMTPNQKLERMDSSFFWEERNVWFSDMWDVKGTKQKMEHTSGRERSAAYPFEIPYRLINMFSQKGDTVLDPFLGTGTTMQAALMCGRSSEGYEIDATLKDVIDLGLATMDLDMCNNYIKQRFDRHVSFIEERSKAGKEIKHFNNHLNVPVMTGQEEEITFNYITSIHKTQDGFFEADYEISSDMRNVPYQLLKQII
ncbi:MAG: site-specific DNA-methyltransferase [Prevotella sp.]|nr:site-specific DNA-methyltransferase [Prevotella sp.]